MIVAWLSRTLLERSRQLLYIAAENPKAALEQGELIRHLDYPETERIGRRTGIRELVVSRTAFVIVYRIRENRQTVEILRLLHGAQQWPTKTGG